MGSRQHRSDLAFSAALGNVKKLDQMIDGTRYSFEYQRNHAGAVKWMKYPSGREIAMSFDAAGRETGVAGGGASYVANARHYPSGAMLDWRLGPNQYEMHGYNRRGQLQDLRLGGSAQGNSVRMLPRAGSDLGAGVYGFAAWLMAPWQGVRMAGVPMLCLGLRRFGVPRYLRSFLVR